VDPDLAHGSSMNSGSAPGDQAAGGGSRNADRHSAGSEQPQFADTRTAPVSRVPCDR
jgi:hypothetical protein